MAAIYDTQVKQQLDEYDIALKGYPISAVRRKEKVKRLRFFLQSLSKNFSSYAICNSKKLGQAFNTVNEPNDKSLRQTYYEDESGTQWRMSFLQVSKNVVKIYRLYQAQFVDESYYRRKIKENTNNTMNKNTQKKTIRLTESDLRKFVLESVKCVLKEGRGTLRDKLFYAVDKFNSFYNAHKEDVDKHINSLKDSGNYKDFETRLAWDIARATRYNKWDCFEKDEWGYAVLPNDSQVTTLFKQALRNSVIKY